MALVKMFCRLEDGPLCLLVVNFWPRLLIHPILLWMSWLRIIFICVVLRCINKHSSWVHLLHPPIWLSASLTLLPELVCLNNMCAWAPVFLFCPKQCTVPLAIYEKLYLEAMCLAAGWFCCTSIFKLSYFWFVKLYIVLGFSGIKSEQNCKWGLTKWCLKTYNFLSCTTSEECEVTLNILMPLNGFARTT